MTESEILIFLKIGFMILFILIVLYVGTIPIRLETFKTNSWLRALGTTFAGSLFINVALLHILPESAQTLQDYLKDGNIDKEVFPLANLLMLGGFLVTIFFTKVISNHTHSDDHQKDGNKKQSLISPEWNEQNEHQHSQKSHNDAYFLTLAMYFHTIFEGIAIGTQNKIGLFLSIAVAIAFHKWADALSMGIHYKNRGVPIKTSYCLIIGQAILNALAIGLGWIIDSFGPEVEAVFLSISAGTFLAISTMQMLGQQFHHRQFILQKFAILVFATGFVSSIWFIQNAIFNDPSS